MSDESNAPADLSNLGIDLSQMFRPSWTTETAGTSDATARLAAKFDEGDRPARGDRHDRQGRPGGRGLRRDGERGPRREGPRNAGPRGNGGQGGNGGEGRDDRKGARDPRERRPEPPQQPVLEGWKLDLVAEEPAIEGIAKQVRSRAKAYPLFELARLIVQLSDRYSVKLTPESDQTAGLFRVKRDGSLWTSRKEAVNHLLAKHLGQFYRKSSVAIEPPKGAFTVVAQCGMSGVLLGPPNHHEYTSRVISLHASRFKNMPFEVYKSRIRMVRDEALIEQWKSEQSTKTIYIPMTPGSENEAPAAEEPAVDPAAESVITTEAVAATEVAEGTESPAAAEITPAAASEESATAEAPAGEPAPESAESDVAEEQAVAEEEVFQEGTAPAASDEGGFSLEQATAHFQEHHAENEVEAAEGEITLSGRAALHDSTKLLRELLLKNLREMDRFPLPLAQAVGKELTGRGLQLFKSHKKIIHVSMARPRYLDREATPIGENFRAILEYLEAHPNQRRDKQWTALLALRTETVETAAPAAPEGSQGAEGSEAAAAVIVETAATAETAPEAPPDALQTPETPAASATPDAETMKKREQALGADLLWLLHQGHVIDFAMGNLQAATRPAPKQPSKKDSAAAAAAAAAATESTDGAVIGNSEEVIVSGSAEHSEIGESDMISEPAEVTAEALADATAEATVVTASSTEKPSGE
jgi:hypothetical protein